MIWGYHTTFDCKFGDKNKITNEDNIRSFVEALVFEIDMMSYGELQISHFAAHNPEVGGYSFCEGLATLVCTSTFTNCCKVINSL